MKIELQCSNCGTRLSLNPTEFWKYGWRFTGVPYCPQCVKTWKERNGKEWNEQYNEELMKDIFYQYLFDKISSEKLDSERYVIYENKESFVRDLNKIRDKIVEIKGSLSRNYQNLADSFVSDVLENNQDNVDLIDNTTDYLQEVIDDLENVTDEIENLEIY